LDTTTPCPTVDLYAANPCHYSILLLGSTAAQPQGRSYPHVIKKKKKNRKDRKCQKVFEKASRAGLDHVAAPTNSTVVITAYSKPSHPPLSLSSFAIFFISSQSLSLSLSLSLFLSLSNGDRYRIPTAREGNSIREENASKLCY